MDTEQIKSAVYPYVPAGTAEGDNPAAVQRRGEDLQRKYEACITGFRSIADFLIGEKDLEVREGRLAAHYIPIGEVSNRIAGEVMAWAGIEIIDPRWMFDSPLWSFSATTRIKAASLTASNIRALPDIITEDFSSEPVEMAVEAVPDFMLGVDTSGVHEWDAKELCALQAPLTRMVINAAGTQRIIMSSLAIINPERAACLRPPEPLVG